MGNLRERKSKLFHFFFFLKALFDVCLINRFSRVRLFAIPWTVAHQEYLSGLQCPPPGDWHCKLALRHLGRIGRLDGITDSMDVSLS